MMGLSTALAKTLTGSVWTQEWFWEKKNRYGLYPFIPDFLKWTLPSLNLDEPISSKKGCRVNKNLKQNAKTCSGKIEKKMYRAWWAARYESSHLDLHCFQSLLSGQQSWIQTQQICIYRYTTQLFIRTVTHIFGCITQLSIRSVPNT